jgi:hypothetical protein
MKDYIDNSEEYLSDVKIFMSYVGRMRTAQKDYFSSRSPKALAQAKILERKVDNMLLDFALHQSQLRRIRTLQEHPAKYEDNTLFESIS